MGTKSVNRGAGRAIHLMSEKGDFIMRFARPVARREAVNPTWIVIFRLAGVAFVLVALSVVVAVPSFEAGLTAETTGVFAGMPKPVSESLGQTIRDLSYIFGYESTYDFLNGVFHVLIPLLLVAPMAALYQALKSIDRGLATKATALGGLSIVTSVALAPLGYTLPAYSDSYALATTQVQRASIVSSSGFAITTLGLGEVLGAFLMFGWIVSVSWILLSHKVFSSWISYLGIASGVVGPILAGFAILGTVVLQSWSAFFFTYMIFTPFFPVTLAWFVVMGYKLFRIV